MTWQGLKLARTLRKNQTMEEQILWELLRNKRHCGLKFYRQYPFRYGTDGKFFIADFYCPSKRLVIELDGQVHDFRLSSDRNRDRLITELGLSVLHIKNVELGDIGNVKQKINEYCSLPPMSHSYKVIAW